uniref:BTB domain-containing protein n=1 Tax=Panagrellus redivivus TaxID=6233 RepID=A0A7E4W679_PANRE
MSIIVHDSIVVEVPDEKKVKPPPRVISGAKGLKWQLEVYPVRRSNPNTEVYIRVIGGSVKIHAWITGGGVTKTMVQSFADGESYGLTALCSVADLRLHSNLVSCLLKVEIPIIAPVTLQELNTNSKEICRIVVGAEHINVNRGFLVMASPVFASLFEGDAATIEVISIDSFSIATVRECLNYTYGHEIGEKSVTEVLNMLDFGHQYKMAPLIDKLEEFLKSRLTVETFAAIAAYGWKYERIQIQNECGQVFHHNKKIVERRDFVELDTVVVVGVLKAAVNFAELANQEVDI